MIGRRLAARSLRRTAPAKEREQEVRREGDQDFTSLSPDLLLELLAVAVAAQRLSEEPPPELTS
jgi:hypothetical protein